MSDVHQGRLYGIGVGPGDSELITVKGARLIAEVDVVAYHARQGGRSTAAKIAAPYLREGQLHELLEYPVTTGITDHPGGYAGAMAQFYLAAAIRLRSHLDAGRSVAVLSLGDPMLYSSYQHLHRLLAEDYAAEIIPGVPSVTAAGDVLAQPLAEEEEVLSIIPGTLPLPELTARLAGTDTAVVMKLGRTFTKVRQAMIDAGVAERAYVVSNATMAGQRVQPVLEADPDSIPYFSCAIVPSAENGSPVEEPRGEVVVVGLGPGDAAWTTPEVTAELKRATDVVGYTTYVNRVPATAGQRLHASDNRVEAERAAMALDLAKEGRRVAVVSSGDPGVFAMAAAVLETADDEQWREVPVRVVPGVTAASAVASRVGAPLGHDFALISLSDRLKPWEIVVTRVRALCAADMAFAVYNPASKTRRAQVAELRDLVAEVRDPQTPVIVARAVGSAEEQVTVTTLADFDPSVVDMRTLLIFGASTTRTYDTAFGPRVFTSRSYGNA